MVAAAVLQMTFIHIVTAAAVGAGLEARLAGTLVASCVVDAELGAAGRAGLALVHLCAGFAIQAEDVAVVAGAARPRRRVLAVVRAAAVVVLAAIHDFHFDAVALLSISPQLKAGITGTGEGSQSVHTTMSTPGSPFCTLVNV